MQSQRISTIIQEYDSQGYHRTGTVTDHLSANWLIDKIRSIGLSAMKESFSLNRVNPITSHIKINDSIIEGLPMFDCLYTDENGIKGTIGLYGDNVDIPVFEMNHGNINYSENLLYARQSGEYKAVIVLTVGETPGLMAINTPEFGQHYGVPVLQISGEYKEEITRAISSHKNVHIMVHADFEQSESYNIITEIKGSNNDLNPIVVMTPRSGWWNCASERGGGIACWLEVMQYIISKKVSRNVIFVATSAHELGAYGIQSFLDKRPDFIKKVSNWVHFGANIGAAVMPGTRFCSSNTQLRQITSNALIKENINDAIAIDLGVILGRESAFVANLGANVVVLQGTNALFHLQKDRWPVSVDVKKIARLSKSFNQIVFELANTE
ncbi:MAG: hypothetical protein FI695_07190 [SAR202 cluster bacterium]|nr:hypothetical protein [Chloroflexota bacterium]MQG51741.1 hypothetical protein [SAR202 cluster bacterium]|tara:strand:- start:2043 stop:3188 length:1146 start_codon:yes stop_codon:yes gene_type:complete